MRPRQNGHHFTDVFKCIFFNEKVWIEIEISRKFVPKGSIYNKSPLIHVMAWRHTGDKPSPKPVISDGPVYWRIDASPALDELNKIQSKLDDAKVPQKKNVSIFLKVIHIHYSDVTQVSLRLKSRVLDYSTRLFNSSDQQQENSPETVSPDCSSSKLYFEQWNTTITA